MLSWHLSKGATNFGETKSFLNLFLDVSVATMFDVATLHQQLLFDGKDSSSELRKLTSTFWCDNSCDVKEVDAAFLLFSSPLFVALTSLFAQQFFLSTPAKQPGWPGSLCLCKNILSFSIFIISRASACAISNKLFKSIWNFSNRCLWISWDFIHTHFFEAPAKQMKIHKLLYTVWRGFCGYSCLSQKNNSLANIKICTFTYSQFNFSNIKKKLQEFVYLMAALHLLFSGLLPRLSK